MSDFHGVGAALGRRTWRLAGVVLLLGAALALMPSAAGASSHAARTGVKPNAVGLLDCNRFSPIQKSIMRYGVSCADPRYLEDGHPARFEDNGHYVGHDEPIIRFLSSRHGSANDITWIERLPKDPSHLPTVRRPGHDVTHWFELSPAPWFGMSLCDGRSYPHNKCTPESDANAPSGPPIHALGGGGGSAFMELQFYPPGFSSGISCDNTHWCSALNIDSLECTLLFAYCNPNCTEPVNFAYIARNGEPAGPPSPQLADGSTFTPNSHTLLMHPGDTIKIHMFDAKIRGGHAFEVIENDRTTGQRGFMIADKANGFMNTELKTCDGHPHNFRPEYDTAQHRNITPWALLETNITTQFEIGHFEPCKRVSNPFNPPVFFQDCHGPYEQTDMSDGGSNPETSDAPCFRKGDRSGGFPDTVTGCIDAVFQNGDLDYDGTSYYADWPNSLTPNRFPSTFRELSPTTNGHGYARMQFETNAPGSDVLHCPPTCTVPIPDSPGNFYPSWTQARVDGQCVWEFGQMTNGNTFGGDAQYGKPRIYSPFTLQSHIMSTPHCGS
jgi:hypothetical protein